MSFSQENCDTVLIACKTIEDELAVARDKTGVSYPTIWIESGLHNTPARLKERLQETLDDIDGCTRVLLAFGNCGNSVQDLHAGDFELIIPRIDDCISILLGTQKRREDISAEYAAIYLTEGWMRGERNIQVEYDYMLEKYGKKMSEEIINMMYKNYRTLALLDTGTYPMDKLADETRDISELLGLQQKVFPATTSFLEQLLAGPWPDDKFVHTPPRSVVDGNKFIFLE